MTHGELSRDEGFRTWSEVAVANVFISHSSADVALAGEVHRWLVEDGHEVFLDQDLRDGIAIGDEWQPRLHERLRWADAMVLLLTSAYVSSAWCRPRWELRSRGEAGWCRSSPNPVCATHFWGLSRSWTSRGTVTAPGRP